MQTGQIQRVKYYIVFTKSGFKHWIFKLLDPDFQHVYAMRKSPGGQFWIVINPLRSHIQTDILLVDDYPHPRTFAGVDSVVVPVESMIDIERERWGLCVFNCVEVVKGLLGIKDFWLLTPRQLYKRITGE